MPVEQRSAIRKWYESNLANGHNPVAMAKFHLREAGAGLRSGGESLLVGGMLGAAHAYLPGGLAYKKVPVDGVVGAIALALGVLGAHHEGAKDIANAGATCLGVMAFRKTHDVICELRKSGEKIGKASFGADPFGVAAMGCEADCDPIVAAARALG